MSKKIFLLSALFILPACNDMKREPKYTPYQPSPFFADGRSTRMPVADTVSFREAAEDKLTDPIGHEPSKLLCEIQSWWKPEVSGTPLPS